tara:strand:- start:5013 stop:5993 length:981 start_codon:yes stop_codon:yes gene_type:complete
MSYQEAFCNITTDLQACLENIDSYDRKRVLPGNWFTTDTTHLYQISNTGFVDLLFVENIEASAVTDSPNANNEFNYSSSTDSLQYYLSGSSVSDLNSKVVEAGQDWATLKQAVVNEQASFIRSYLNDRSIYKRNNSNYQGPENRSYDFVIIRSNALLACADLVRSQDNEKADQLYDLAMGDNGLLTRLKRGDFALWHETTKSTQGDPTISEISVNANTTGYIEDIKMTSPALTDYDQVVVEIQTGGTFVLGTASPVYYNVYVKDSTGLKMHKIVDNQQVIGDYQDCAYGSQVRFQTGVYTSSDQWLITFQRDSLPVGSISSGQVYR